MPKNPTLSYLLQLVIKTKLEYLSQGTIIHQYFLLTDVFLMLERRRQIIIISLLKISS